MQVIFELSSRLFVHPDAIQLLTVSVTPALNAIPLATHKTTMDNFVTMDGSHALVSVLAEHADSQSIHTDRINGHDHHREH